MAKRFAPTRRQALFRQLAELLYLDDKASTVEYCRASRLLALGEPVEPGSMLSAAMAAGRFEWMGKQVTVKEFKRWEAKPGFIDWWSVAFPEVAVRSEADIRMAAGLHWEAIIRGLKTGDRSMVSEYTKILAMREKEQGPTGSLDDHFEPDNVPNDWLKDDGEE